MIFSYCESLNGKAVICRKADWERLTTNPRIFELVEAFRKGNVTAKKQLPGICFQASFPQGQRKSKEARPSGLYIGDWDDMPEEKLKALIERAVPKEEEQATSPILLVHITPSGKGLRVVAKATKQGPFANCSSIADYQKALGCVLGDEEYLDKVCTDYARLSFVPRAEDIIYINNRLFEEAPEVTEFAESHLVPCNPANGPCNPANGSFATPGTVNLQNSSQESYDGASLKEIFDTYISITGGLPQEGVRNSRYYAAARDLRYICDFNPSVIANHLPDCGLPQTEVYQLCVSACQSNRAATIPEMVRKAVVIAKAIEQSYDEAEESSSSVIEVPVSILPPLARELVSAAPVDFQEATLLTLLPIVGTLATHVRARYVDYEIQSPSFFTVVSSEQASGKSFARRLVRQLLRPIAEEDEIQRTIEQQYRDKLKMKKNAKEQPEQPRVKIRLVPASISIAKLLQRLDFAEGDHLFSFAEEMDTLIKSNKSGAWAEKNDLYREGFDNAEYGQDFMSETSYSTSKPVFYNLLVLGTPRQTQRFFVDVENGLVSRTIFTYIPDQFGAQMPIWKPLSDDTLKHIDEMVGQLQAAQGEVDLSFLHPALNRFLDYHRLLSLQENNRARDIFRRRSAVIGFRAAMTFTPLFPSLESSETQQKLSEFAVYVAETVLRNQLTFAQTELNAVSEDEETKSSKSVTQTIFENLNEEFTTNQLSVELRHRSMRSLPRKVIYRWCKAGLIEKIAINKYRKLKGLKTNYGNND